MLNPFEEKLKKRLENYQENPAPDTWDGIDKRLQTSEPGGMDAANLLTELGLLIFLGFIILNNAVTTEQNDLARNSITGYDTATHLALRNSANDRQAETFSVYDSSQRHGREIKLLYAQKDFKQPDKSSNEINADPHISQSTNSTTESLKKNNPLVVPKNKKLFAVQNIGGQKAVGFTRNSKGTSEMLSNNRSAQPFVSPIILVQEDNVDRSEFLNDQTERFSDTVDTATKPSIHLDSVKGVLPSDSLSTSKKHRKKDKNSILSNGLWHVQVTPLLTYQRLESNRQDNQYVDDLNSPPIFSPKRLGFRIEAGRVWAINQKLSISLGMMYLQQNQQIGYSTRTVERMEVVETSSGTVTMAPVFEDVDRIFDFQSKSIGLSTQITYLVMRASQLKSYVGGGLDYQVTLSPVTYKNEFSESARNLNLTFFYRVMYPLSERMMIYAQPSYSFAIRNRNSFSTSLYSAPYSVGMGIGILFNK